jgi:hypothetical protein
MVNQVRNNSSWIFSLSHKQEAENSAHNIFMDVNTGAQIITVLHDIETCIFTVKNVVIV